ncbi:unnamed protein product [Hapterophycus canaliculatus]
MLSPQGLAAKKITLEGFAVPVSLRLLDRRPQQQQQKAVGSTVTEPAALSITWIDLDTFGFDIAGLTSIRRGGVGEERLGHGAETARRKRSWHGASKDGRGQEPLVLVLSWGTEGAGPAEVAFELATAEERDLVATTLEMLVAGLAGQTAQPADDYGRSGSEIASSCGAELGPQQSAVDIATSRRAVGDNPRSSGGGGGDSKASWSAGRFPTPPHTDTDIRLAPAGKGEPGTAAVSGGLSRLSSSSDTAVTARSRELRDITTLVSPSRPGIRRRGASFGPARECFVAPELTRSRTSGGVMERRESEPEVLQPEREVEERRRRQQAMVRLLVMYDRTRDEARASSWRLGAMRLKRLLSAAATRQTEKCWARWCGGVRRANERREKSDRRLWYLHAKANQNNDLLAWYHATFCREVYRRRG